MQTCFSTDAVHTRDKFDYWHSVACEKIVNHDSRPDDRLNFTAEIQTAKLKTVELLQFSNSPMQVSHTLAQVKKTSPDWVFVCCQLDGKVVLSQNGSEAALTPGTLALVEPLLPYDAKFSDRSKTLCLKIPRTGLRARVGRNRELAARLVTGDRIDDSLTLSLVAGIPLLAGKISPATEEVVENHALDLIGLSLARNIEGSRSVSIPKAIQLSNIRSAINTRLADPALDSGKVAEAVGISVRYANRLFAETGSSINRFITSERLARCRHALGDPYQAHRTVREIAQGWGFSDMTHFARRFREAYGMAPSEYRRGTDHI